MPHNKKKQDKTVGKIAVDLMQGPQENKDSIAQTDAMLSDFDKNFYEAFDRGKAQFSGIFHVVVITKKERLLENVLRNYFLVRESCPTPDYDQTVYRCDQKRQIIDLLWTVPNIQACEMFRDRADSVPSEQKELLKCVLAFYDGTLLRRCKEFNKELKESSASDSFNPEDFDDYDNHVIVK
jgi:hypothetical protein